METKPIEADEPFERKPLNPAEEEIRRSSLSDITGDGGGQMNQVGSPYDGKGTSKRGLEKKIQQKP